MTQLNTRTDTNTERSGTTYATTLDEVRGRGTVPVWSDSEPNAASVLGMGRSVAYSTARLGTFPVPVIRVGRSLRVSVPALLRLLGDTSEA